jgi:biotin carboxyl carrier protein
VTFSREECIGLMQAVSKTGIDRFELRSGPVEIVFDRREPAAPSGGAISSDPGRPAVEVLSPVLGICRPAPGEDDPPYARIGQAVLEDDIICSIGVLDRRVDVAAGAKGIIVELNAVKGELVEYGQLLAVIQTFQQTDC